MNTILAKKEKEGSFSAVKTLFGDIMHILDIYTDLSLAKEMY